MDNGMRAAGEKRSKGAASGLVALVFLVLGFQLAVFVMKVVERDARSEPGMTEVSEPDVKEETEPARAEAGEAAGGSRRSDLVSGARRLPEQRSGRRPSAVSKPKVPARTYASFVFDPNTVTMEDLQRLGLSERQAATIENYRAKGGRFRSKADFQKMYVVSDTLFARLEPFIDIPKLELNTADSTALVTLRGIGPYYARKILAYRDRLGGFYDKAQLLEIEGIDSERYEGLADAVTVDPAKIRPLDLWHASDSLLAQHPYLGAKGARSVIRYRALYDSTRWTPADLAAEHALPEENIEKLKKYIEIQ